MVTGTDTTLDLHFLESLGLLVLLWICHLCCSRLVSDLGSEDDVFSESGGVAVRAGGAAGFNAHLRPLLALRYTGLFVDALGDGSEALGALDFLAVLVQENGDNRLGAILVLGALWCWDGRSKICLFVLGPVGAARCVRHDFYVCAIIC